MGFWPNLPVFSTFAVKLTLYKTEAVAFFYGVVAVFANFSGFGLSLGALENFFVVFGGSKEFFQNYPEFATFVVFLHK